MCINVGHWLRIHFRFFIFFSSTFISVMAKTRQAALRECVSAVSVERTCCGAQGRERRYWCSPGPCPCPQSSTTSSSCWSFSAERTTAARSKSLTAAPANRPDKINLLPQLWAKRRREKIPTLRLEKLPMKERPVRLLLLGLASSAVSVPSSLLPWGDGEAWSSLWVMLIQSFKLARPCFNWLSYMVGQQTAGKSLPNSVLTVCGEGTGSNIVCIQVSNTIISVTETFPPWCLFCHCLCQQGAAQRWWNCPGLLGLWSSTPSSGCLTFSWPYSPPASCWLTSEEEVTQTASQWWLWWLKFNQIRTEESAVTFIKRRNVWTSSSLKLRAQLPDSCLSSWKSQLQPVTSWAACCKSTDEAHQTNFNRRGGQVGKTWLH